MLSRLAVISIVTLAAFAQSGCNYDILRDNGRRLPNPTATGGEKPAEVVDFETVKTKVLAPRCFECHDEGSSKGDLETYAVVMQKFVVAGDPMGSPIYSRLKNVGRDMPKGQPQIPDEEAELIRAWIAGGAIEKAPSPSTEPTKPEPQPEPGPQPNPQPGPEPEPQPEPGPQPQPQPDPQPQPQPQPEPQPNPQPQPAPVEPTWASIQSAVVAPKCVMCHSGATPKAGIDLSSYDLIAKWVDPEDPDRKLLVPGDLDASLFFTVIRDEEMPRKKDIKAGKVQAVTPEEIKAIEAWVASGANP